jgi:hypothetical protein
VKVSNTGDIDTEKAVVYPLGIIVDAVDSWFKEETT